MNKLIIGLLFLLVSQTLQAGILSLSWMPPVERADNTTLDILEISGYTIYYGTETGNYTNSIFINGGSTKQYDLMVSDGFTYYLVLTTRDTDGRESQYSTVITKSLVSIIPNVVTNFKVTNIPGTLDYEFTYTDPTAYINGDLIPDGAIVKRYIFGNGKWIRDIPFADKSFILTLAPGDYVFDMEVETRTDMGTLIVSNRSVKINISVPVLLSPPKPPTMI